MKNSISTFLRLALLLVVVSTSMRSLATHIVGGEISYEFVSTNAFGQEEYIITLKVYRDCGPSNTLGTGFDEFASIGIFVNNSLYQNVTLLLTEAIVNELPVALENPCFVLPPDVCVEEAIYKNTVFLDVQTSNYDLVYQRCCRNPTITNLLVPAESGATFWTQIPGTNIIDEENSSPAFNQFPPVALCTNAAFVFDHSATDLDGDSLVYSFCNPMHGASPDFPAPSPPESPPFVDVVYDAGYSATYPIDSDPAFEIDAETGEITGTPSQSGQYVIGVCVAEYRNGILLSESNRDFQFNVTLCDPAITAAIPEQSQFCDGLTFEFFNSSIGADGFYWDFGDPTTTNDNSTLNEPTYTYPDTGIYVVTLIANPGWSCADTSTTEYAAYPLIDPIIINTGYDCPGEDPLFDFEAGGDYDSDAGFLWDFGEQASPQFSDVQNPEEIDIGDVNLLHVVLTIFDNGCEATSDFDLEIPPNPQAVIDPQDEFCNGLTYDFTQSSLGAEDYLWDFGVPGISTDISIGTAPSFTYPDTGVYQVSLVVSTPFTCPDSITETFEIYTLLDPFFIEQDPQCFEGNTFLFNPGGTEDSNAQYAWGFGPNANIQTSILQQPSGISYDTTGTFSVFLTISENGCEESYMDEVEVIPNPTIEFELLNESGCPPLMIHFEDLSSASTQIFYDWDFGDGQHSTQQNPSHFYDVPGSYDVTLHIETTTGCIDQATHLIPNAVTVYPSPTAGFFVYPREVDILEPTITVEDDSFGGVQVNYTISDGGHYILWDFEHDMLEAGMHTVTQTVINEFGCLDTIRKNVFVNGFLFWAPNAFTPDHDGRNDVWQPVFTGVTKYRAIIYDRWGTIVYESDDPYQPWLGNVREGEHFAQHGIYSYYIVAHDLLGLPHEFSGHIALIR